eukprot:COSAG01_NODE_3325_length_6252_cov_17.673980_2_plen_67_part_00
MDCDVSDVEGQLDQLPALAKFVTARKRAKRVAQAIESYTSASYSGNVDLRGWVTYERRYRFAAQPC